MALNTLKCNRLIPLSLKELSS